MGKDLPYLNSKSHTLWYKNVLNTRHRQKCLLDFSYVSNFMDEVGLYVATKPMSPENCYFEIEIIDTGEIAAIGIGLVPKNYPLNSQPGWRAHSVGYHADDGRLVVKLSTIFISFLY